MNKFIQAIQKADFEKVEEAMEKKPGWLNWSEKDGKNALHFLSAIDVSRAKEKVEPILKIARFLLKKGMDINSIHRIPERKGFFPATPVWYAYTRGRNEKLYSYFLKNGGSPEHCMFAIAWNDEVKAAKLFKKYGAKITDAPFLAAFYWRRFKMTEWFLENGADVNYIGPEGYSALLLAVRRRAPVGQIKLLLEYGADIHKENKVGLSPLKLAESNRQREVLKLFAVVKK